MIELATKLPELTLHPGELQLVRNPTLLQTILGSCVGVTFWNARLGAGALCHGVLPRSPLDWRHDAALSNGPRFVDFSIRFLAARFDALGARRQEVEVKLFGGADVLPVSEARGAKPTVGAMNCSVALEVLEDEGFAILASDLGGNRGRKIHFDTGTGQVLVQRLGAWRDLPK